MGVGGRRRGRRRRRVAAKGVVFFFRCRTLSRLARPGDDAPRMVLSHVACRAHFHFAYPGDAIARRGGSFDRTRKHDERHRRSPLAHRRAPRARDPQGRRQGPRGTSRSSRPRRRTLANRSSVANLPRVARVCRVRALAAPSRRARMPRPPWRSRDSHGAIPPSPPAISPRTAGPLHRHGPEAGASRSRDPRLPAHARPATAWQSRTPNSVFSPRFQSKVFPTPPCEFEASKKETR